MFGSAIAFSDRIRLSFSPFEISILALLLRFGSLSANVSLGQAGLLARTAAVISICNGEVCWACLPVVSGCYAPSRTRAGDPALGPAYVAKGPDSLRDDERFE